jgi:hypothetical protein
MGSEEKDATSYPHFRFPTPHFLTPTGYRV